VFPWRDQVTHADIRSLLEGITLDSKAKKSLELNAKWWLMSWAYASDANSSIDTISYLREAIECTC
jgi:hypothetical protein